ncbi:ATP synthase F1 gamma [Cantharellus anzutake]|uniref:ATP synthase F1 gamma n=1 Tax=Cantharellus anzutake TaxID=1750568 RepID=UPI001907E765|nr:ATP synthase F1 gamma [Cantharellus anzutake]KAF8329083.1 ATP synthase F1 gamma [Cantharellus anzutake]
MLTGAARSAASRVVLRPTLQTRNMATLREIELRLKSVRNIEKITKSMKMIASTKLAKAQRAMANAKNYGLASNEVFKNVDAPGGDRKLFVVISSDRGLCGGIHSSVTKATRRLLDEGNEDARIVVLGDKSKSQLTRLLPNNLLLTFNQVGKDVPTFADACVVANFITKSNAEFDSVHIVYNEFVSAISYQAAAMKVVNQTALQEAPNFKQYEMEDDVTEDLTEFSIANAVYAALVEGHAAEISSRRNAMDNASKNAGEMITSLQMKYNRGRQAAITNELVDIITGASAL